MNLKKIIGGNGNLSPNGQKYGIALGDYIRSTIDQNNTRFITSTLNRTLQTAKLAQVDIFDKVLGNIFEGLLVTLQHGDPMRTSQNGSKSLSGAL